MTPEKQADKRLSRRQRVVRKLHFAEAYESGRRFDGKFMTMWLRASTEEPSLKLGVVAGKFVGNAVKRARAKRVMREVFRLNRHSFVPGSDVVLRARSQLPAAARNEVEADLLSLARRARLLAAAEGNAAGRRTPNIERPAAE